MKDNYKNLKQLGNNSGMPESPQAAKLEKVLNPHMDVAYAVKFTCPEFTSLCPVTGQPDFAHIVIDYVPGRYLVESKSLNYSFSLSATMLVFTRNARLQLQSA